MEVELLWIVAYSAEHLCASSGTTTQYTYRRLHVISDRDDDHDHVTLG